MSGPKTSLVSGEDARVVYVTAPDGDAAAALARALVGEGLIACANLVPGVRSIYAWRGAVCDDAEVLLLLKTSAARLEALLERVVALHPYDVPEFLAMPVSEGSRSYLDWIAENTMAGGRLDAET